LEGEGGGRRLASTVEFIGPTPAQVVVSGMGVSQQEARSKKRVGRRLFEEETLGLFLVVSSVVWSEVESRHLQGEETNGLRLRLLGESVLLCPIGRQITKTGLVLLSILAWDLLAIKRV